MAESIITSVSGQTAFSRPHGDSSSDFLPAQVPLNVRGRRFVLDRETLNHLPDALLNTMFPGGLMPLARGYDSYAYGGYEEPELTWVDFDPDMLEYVLQAYGQALGIDLLAASQPAPDAWPNYSSDGRANIAGTPAQRPPRNNRATDPSDSLSSVGDESHVNTSSAATQSTSSSAVLNYMRFVSAQPARDDAVVYADRSPLVVLREELDYFVVPASGRTHGDISSVAGFSLDMAKTRCGELLAEDDSVFEPLERTMQRNLDKWRAKSAEGAADDAHALQSASIIEQQLIDMLCLAGFPRDARWGCRRVEPSKTSVSSLLTVPLDESADHARAVAAQKLLLFYKKPARKCWWEGEDVNAGDSDHKINLKLWCRRTWTLELVLV
ncbi:hypothetical protein LPJ78_005783 [Coemansia sp. RSA 989]|nr:hypothetical protein LPJ68_005770 [Coemansia sp. RSA 1086]KAJ1746991.1 hypothetical protein LPJ79_005563 [Coemansia sp. RSA 1821]KAJ1860556.1 hypothetical protein LPJ78_005783 [Coemansia sp. RSA 989]KAJ1870544.1 hypothetical protein LPJ55_004572 [Coemansia sp. RSA 990]KAJ2630404.1 hypothetical protein H4R22_002690 [Coemansia sp. RSA 1290]KAJ2653689.1 hypothetical protein IWW40_000384 [Coemansia sp. RSA 1250]KAJ2667615.1 hypothetical protein IWW42_005794 [Coemansia sp. RSA 1085]